MNNYRIIYQNINSLQLAANMSSYLSYNDAYKVIKKAKTENVCLIDIAIKSMNEFVGFCNESNKKLKSIKYELPTSKKKKIFEKEKGPKGFSGMEPILDKVWKKLVENYLSQPKSMIDMCSLIQKDLINPLKELKNYYIRSMEEIEDQVGQILSTYVDEEANYKKVSTKYRNDCVNIQGYHDNLKKSENEKMRDKYMDLKNNYKNSQLETIDETKKFNAIQSEYAVTMEEALLNFERLDKIKDEKTLDIFNSILDKIDSISKECGTQSDEINNIIQEINQEEANALLLGNENIDNQKIVSVKFKPVPLSVKLNEISPSVTFEKELKCFRAIAKNKINSDQIKLEQGDMVKVIKVKGGQWEVIDFERNHMGTVSSTDFIEKQELKPKLAKLNANISGNDSTCIKAEAGDTILIEYIKENEAFCSDVFGREGFVPLSKLLIE